MCNKRKTKQEFAVADGLRGRRTYCKSCDRDRNDFYKRKQDPDERILLPMQIKWAEEAKKNTRS